MKHPESTRAHKHESELMKNMVQHIHMKWHAKTNGVIQECCSTSSEKENNGKEPERTGHHSQRHKSSTSNVDHQMADPGLPRKARTPNIQKLRVNNTNKTNKHCSQKPKDDRTDMDKGRTMVCDDFHLLSSGES